MLQRQSANPDHAIGVDIGGSGIKAAVVDISTGELTSQRVRVKTPSPSTPARCIQATVPMVAAVAAEVGLSGDTPAGVGIPAVTIGGVVLTAANIDKDWIGFPAGVEFTKGLARPTVVVNDADAAGIAEMRFGAGRDQKGTVLMLTLGTGIGSAVFLDGRLVPNTEFGHIEIRGKDAEQRASAYQRERRKLSWAKWAAEVDTVLHRIDLLLWPDLVIIGGGVSKEADRFIPLLTARQKVVPAQMRNEAGIVGAAMLAAGFGGPPDEPPVAATASPARATG
jgi:polyphosphate glucokinase